MAEPSGETCYRVAAARLADLQGRIDRTVNYVEKMLALDGLNPDVRLVGKAVRHGLTMPSARPETEARGG